MTVNVHFSAGDLVRHKLFDYRGDFSEFEPIPVD